MNIPPGERQGTDCMSAVPAFVKDFIDSRYRFQSDKAPNLTIGQWLNAQPPEVQRREGRRILRKYGLRAYY
jgi:hypothetical protein